MRIRIGGLAFMLCVLLCHSVRALNPSIDISESHKIRRSADFRALIL